MKKCLSVFAVFLLLTACHANAGAQSNTVTQDDTRASLDISKHIIQLIGALAKDFADVKGELLTKTDDGTSVYGVVDMDAMKAEDQYIMIKSGGAAYYIASYKSDGDAKRLTLSFAAFTAGVITLTNGDGNFTIEQDKEKSTDEKLVYIMSVKGTKVGSYTMEAKKGEGTLIIGFL